MPPRTTKKVAEKETDVVKPVKPTKAKKIVDIEEDEVALDKEESDEEPSDTKQKKDVVEPPIGDWKDEANPNVIEAVSDEEVAPVKPEKKEKKEYKPAATPTRAPVAASAPTNILDFNESEIRKLNSDNFKDFDTNTLFKVLFVRGKDSQNPSLANIAKSALLELNFQQRDFEDRSKQYNPFDSNRGGRGRDNNRGGFRGGNRGGGRGRDVRGGSSGRDNRFQHDDQELGETDNRRSFGNPRFDRGRGRNGGRGMTSDNRED